MNALQDKSKPLQADGGNLATVKISVRGQTVMTGKKTGVVGVVSYHIDKAIVCTCPTIALSLLRYSMPIGDTRNKISAAEAASFSFVCF